MIVGNASTFVVGFAQSQNQNLGAQIVDGTVVELIDTAGGVYQIKSYAFTNCSALTTVSFPQASYIGSGAFAYCIGLTTVSFPQASYIDYNAFYNCYSLTTVSFPKVSYIHSSAFGSCYNLTSLYLLASSVCSLVNSNAFSSTPIGGYSVSAGTYGSIYIPASLYSAYLVASNWSYFSSRFVSIFK